MAGRNLRRRATGIEALEDRRLMAVGDVQVQITRAGLDFGADVDLVDDMLVVGAPGDDAPGTNVGRVYVYQLNGTSNPPLVRTIENPLASALNFGRKLDLDGTKLIVSAKDTAFLFDLADPQFEHTITDPTNNTGDDFAADVAISQEYYAVTDKANGFFGGAEEVHAYDLATNTHLLLSSTDSGQGLSTVCISGKQVAIGFATSVQVYDASTSNLVDSFAIPQGSLGYTSTAIQGQRIVAGGTLVPSAAIGGQAAGEAYLFDIGQANATHTWSNPDPVAMPGLGNNSEQFGATVAFDGLIGAVGEPQGESADAGQYDSPAIHIYNTTSGNKLTTVIAPAAPLASTSPNYHFGRALAVSGQHVAVGADSAVFVLDSGLAALNQAPSLTAVGATATYNENGSGALIAPNALLTDADSANFATGVVTVKVAANANANDRLFVGNQGTLAGQIGVSGISVTFGGTLIGSFTGGSGSAPLVITLNSHATVAATQALLRNLRFKTLSDAPSTAVRTVSLSVSDGDGATSATRNVAVSIVPKNDAPVLNTSAAPILPAVDEDTANPTGTTVTNFAGSIISDPDAGAVKGIAVVGLTEKIHGSWEFSIDGGTNWTSLDGVSDTTARVLGPGSLVRFVPNPNYNGTPQVKFRAWDQTDGAAIGSIVDTTGKRGGTGAYSTAAVSAKLTVTPVNDNPVLTLSGSVGYVRNAAPIALAPNALLADDSPNFGGGQLRVRITLGAGAKNTLAIGGAFTIDANNNVKLGGTIVGVRSSNGIGTNELKVDLNTAATKAIVQQLVRAITYQNIGGSGGKRTVIFSVSDGDGGLSDDRTKSVNVT